VTFFVFFAVATYGFPFKFREVIQGANSRQVEHTGPILNEQLVIGQTIDLFVADLVMVTCWYRVLSYIGFSTIDLNKRIIHFHPGVIICSQHSIKE